ncbi:MAG: hypothetical protein HY318_12285 [Armatimonadetes bacterium]|nr:hypothetical protein [Armatimonadota bacterium]
MRINVSIAWDRAPAEGRFEFENVRYVGGGINVGWGSYSEEDFRFSFTSTTEICRLSFGLEVEDRAPATNPLTIKVVDTAHPFTVAMPEVLKEEGGTMHVEDSKVTVRAGCKIPEDVGTSLERYPGDYAVRVVETTVIVES